MPSSLQPAEKLCELVPALWPQVLLAFTDTVPAAVTPQVTSIILLPCPASIVPLETVQLYAGSGDAGVTKKFTNPPAHQTDGLAVIAPGLFGLPQMVLLFLIALVAGGHNVELAATVKNPLVNVDDTFNRMVDPVADPEIVVPAGFVQV